MIRFDPQRLSGFPQVCTAFSKSHLDLNLIPSTTLVSRKQSFFRFLIFVQKIYHLSNISMSEQLKNVGKMGDLGISLYCEFIVPGANWVQTMASAFTIITWP